MSLFRDILDGTRGRETTGIVASGGALLLFAALASYHADDPSYFMSSGAGPRNWIGPFGAQLSAALFQLLGLAAWLLPPALGIAAFRRLRPSGGSMRGSAVAGLATIALATTVLLALVVGQVGYRGGALPAGGLVGLGIAALLGAGLGQVGALVATGTALVVGLVLAARSSLADLAPSPAPAKSRRAAPARPRRGFRDALGRLRPRWPAFLRRSRQATPTDPAPEAARPTPPAAPPITAPRPVVAAAETGRDDAAPTRSLLDRLLRRKRTPDPEPSDAPLDSADEDDLDDFFDGLEDEVEDEEDTGAAATGPARALRPAIDPDDPLGIEGAADAEAEAAPAEPAPTGRRRKAARPAVRAVQARLPVDIPPSQAKLPPVELLTAAPPPQAPNREELVAVARAIESRCAEFNVVGQVVAIHPGPVVTTYEFRPDAGIKLVKITALADDLALGLEAESVRMDRIPGRNAIGIEVPNRRREAIVLRELLESEPFRRGNDLLTVALGKTQEGELACASLAKMPHVLIAGATGSGKSVGLNGVITSILYRARPDQVKFILIDPKMLELGLYEGIPHLLVPVVTDMKHAANALKWSVREMDRRYRLLASCNVRHLDHFNKLVERDPALVQKAIDGIPARGEAPEKYEAKPLPYIVIVVDELADMLMTTEQETEECIARLAQKARAVGIHLVLATQRPSVDVLTGSIKANFPARIAYRVASKIDSRTILDAGGAERLLGAGDMLYRQPGSARLQRIHGAFVSEDENLRVVTWLKGQAKAEYDKSIIADPPDESSGGEDGGGDIAGNDPVYRKAVRLVVATGQASTSFLQRRMRLGYSRAARIIDQMEQDGIVGKADGSRPRQVLVDAEFLERMDQQDDE